MTLAVGLVGLGYGENVLLPALRRVPGVHVTSVACAHPEKARDAARRLGIPRSAAAWRELVDDPGVGAVVLAVPPVLQAAIARRAILAGKPVFCEKPLAPNVRMADALAALAAKRRVVTAVDFEFPEIGAWKAARALLDQGAIGRLRELQVVWNVETYAVKQDLRSWKTDPKAGGGVLNNFASHSFHYIEFWAGRIRRIACRLGRASGLKRIQGETGAAIWAETNSGEAVSAVVTTHAPGEASHQLTLIGSGGRLVLENRGSDYAAGFTLTRHLASGKTEKIHLKGPVLREDGRIAPAAEIAGRWAAAVRSGGACQPGFAEGARAQRLIEAARRAAKTEKWVACG